MIRVVHPGSGFRFTHPGSRIQGSKRHQIPDPQHGLKLSESLTLGLPVEPLVYMMMPMSSGAGGHEMEVTSPFTYIEISASQGFQIRHHYMVNMVLKLGNFLEICVFLQAHRCPEISTHTFFANNSYNIALQYITFPVFYHNYIISSNLVMHRPISANPNSSWQQKK
jgi:hypothetical protein